MVWQKAKIAKADNTRLVGLEVWVRGRPYVSPCRDRFRHPLPAATVMDINLLDEDGNRCVASLDYLDLESIPLAERFCDSPRLIPFAEWFALSA